MKKIMFFDLFQDYFVLNLVDFATGIETGIGSNLAKL